MPCHFTSSKRWRTNTTSCQINTLQLLHCCFTSSSAAAQLQCQCGAPAPVDIYLSLLCINYQDTPRPLSCLSALKKGLEMKHNTGQWPCLHYQLCLCSGQHIHQSLVASVSPQVGLLQQLLQDAARTALSLQHWLESCLQPAACLGCCQLPCCIPLILSCGLCSKKPFPLLH